MKNRYFLPCALGLALNKNPKLVSYIVVDVFTKNLGYSRPQAQQGNAETLLFSFELVYSCVLALSAIPLPSHAA